MNRTTKLVMAGGLVAMAIGAGGCTPTVIGGDFASAGKLLADGNTLKASNSMTASLRTSGAGVTSATNTDFSVETNNDGGIDIEADGKTMSFSDSDVSGDQWRKDGNPQQVAIAFGKSTREAIDEDDKNYSQVWQYFYADNSPEQLTGFAVVGNETPVGSMPTSADATYVGQAGMIVSPVAGNIGQNSFAVQWGTDDAKRANRSSDARLEADFAAKSVNGAFTGAVVIAGNTATSDARFDVTLQNGNISGNGFSGNLTGNNIDNGSYEGKFFGPSAEEAAGVVEMSRGGGTFLGAGAFHLVKD